jgi:hypothetical protein
MIYDDKPVLRAIIEALGAELDELNDAIIACKNDRWIDTAEGVQLDGLGEIVVMPRQIDKALALTVFGFDGQTNTVGFGQARFLRQGESALGTYILSDAEYRMLIAVKARQNVTDCTVEDTIASLKYVFDAPRIIIEETGNATITVAIGRKLTPNQIALANAMDLIIRAGGVGIKYKAFFDGSPFGFLGQQDVMGFGQGSFARAF